MILPRLQCESLPVNKWLLVLFIWYANKATNLTLSGFLDEQNPISLLLMSRFQMVISRPVSSTNPEFE